MKVHRDQHDESKWFMSRLKECCHEAEKEMGLWFYRVSSGNVLRADATKAIYASVVFEGKEIASCLHSDFIMTRLRKGMEIMGGKVDAFKPTQFIARPVNVTIREDSEHDCVDVVFASYALGAGEDEKFGDRPIVRR